MIRIIAPKGKMIRHILTERFYSEVICEDRENIILDAEIVPCYNEVAKEER